MSVKVAIRVRPFNQRERFLGCTACVQMKNNTTVVYQNRGKQKKQHYFTFDYSFWSHDGFQQKQNGYLVPIDQSYVDQSRVYQLLGQQILQNAWVGFNCCLFAYGQTGAGKSYSMIGYGANKGIIPMACQQLFQRIKRFQRKGQRQYQVSISMLQIYNEKVQDLFINTNKRTTNGLKIRQNKALGVYVEGLNKFPVFSYAEIQKKMEQGSKNRSLASTLMNQYSSRAHTIVMLEFIQKQWITKGKMSKKTSLINLVDLAGSQRVSKTGVGDNKDRLKQASLINKSLHTLGRVIEALADQCVGKIKNIAVPYRQSALTRILQNALGGNSKTTMICAISPANDNCQQTLSTLRYADKTKKIKNKPVVNQSQVDKLIRQLRQQNQRLKKMLESSEEQKSPFKGNLSNSQTQQQRKQMKSNVRASMREIQKQIRKNLQSFAINTDQPIDEQDCQESLMMTEYIDLQDPSLASEWQTSFTSTTGKSQVYITNLSEDQLLNFKIKYSCQNNLLITNKNSKKDNNILQEDPIRKVVLCGLGIEQNHAKITKQNGKYFIQALTQTSTQYTLLNGKPVHSKQQLRHNDRIILGTNSVFLFKNLPNPQQRANKKYTSQKSVGYEFAINERQQQFQDQNSIYSTGSPSRRRNSNQSNMATQDKQLLSRLQQIQQEFTKMIQQNQRKTKQKQQKYKQKLLDLQRQKQQKQKEKQRLQSKLNEKKQETYKLRTKQLQIEKLHKKLAQFEQEKEKRKKIRQSMLLDDLDNDRNQLDMVGLTHFQDIEGSNHNQIGVGQDDINNYKGNKKNNKIKNETSSPNNDIRLPIKDQGFQQVYLQEYDQKNSLGTTYFTTNFDAQTEQYPNSLQNKMKKNSKQQPYFQEQFNEAEELQKYNKIVNVYLGKIKHRMGVFTKLYDITIYSQKLALSKKQQQMQQFNCQKNGGYHFCRHCRKVINNNSKGHEGHSTSTYNIYMDQKQQYNVKSTIGDASKHSSKQKNSSSRHSFNNSNEENEIQKYMQESKNTVQRGNTKRSFNKSKNVHQKQQFVHNQFKQTIQNLNPYQSKQTQIESDKINNHFNIQLNKSNLSDFLKEQQERRKNSQDQNRKSDSLADESLLLNGTSIDFDQNFGKFNNRRRVDSQQLIRPNNSNDKFLDGIQEANSEESQLQKVHNDYQNRIKTLIAQKQTNNKQMSKIKASDFVLDDENQQENQASENRNSQNEQALLSYLSQTHIQEVQVEQRNKKSQKYLSAKKDNFKIVPITPIEPFTPVPKSKPIYCSTQIQTDVIAQQSIKQDSLQIKPKQATKIKRQQYIAMDFDFSVSDIQQGDHQNSMQQSLNLSSLNSFKQIQLTNQIQLLKQKIKSLQTQNNVSVKRKKSLLEKAESQQGQSYEDQQFGDNSSNTAQKIRSRLKLKKYSKQEKIQEVEQEQDEMNSPRKSQPTQSAAQSPRANRNPKRLSSLPQNFSQKQFLLRRRRQNGQLDQQLQKQLQTNIIVCNNENIINERNLNIRKRKRQVQQLKKSLFKKQKIQLQKQLFNLIPMVQRFNLIAKDMNRLIQAKIEIEYRNFSHYEIIEALKNFTKSKWKKDSNFSNVQIRIVVANLQEARIYKWPLEVFKNRFQIADQIFQKYIQNNQQNTLISPYNSNQIDRTKDPFWDPLDYVPNGVGYLSIECILYDVDYEGEISFVYNSAIIAKAYINIVPVKVKKRANNNNTPNSVISQQLGNQNSNNKQMSETSTIIQASNNYQNQLQIFNPRNCLQKSLYFTLSIDNIIFFQSKREHTTAPLKFQISYELLIDDYKNQTYTTPEVQFKSFEDQHELNYLQRHCFKEISESTLAYISDCPIKFNLNVMKDYNEECLNSSFNQDLDRSLDETNSVMDTSMASSNMDAMSDLSDTISNKSYKTPQKSNSGLSNSKSSITESDIKKPDFSKKQTKSIIYENSQMLDKMNKQAEQEQKRRKQKRQKLMQKEANLKSKKDKLKKDDKDCTIY